MHQGPPTSQRTHLTQVSTTLLQFFTLLLSDAKPVKMSQALKSKKGPLFFYINSGKLETTLNPTLD